MTTNASSTTASVAPGALTESTDPYCLSDLASAGQAVLAAQVVRVLAGAANGVR